MKKYAVLLLIPLILILSSCANADISYRLTDDEAVRIEYELSSPSDDENIPRYFESIAAYWDDMGFSTETSDDDEFVTVYGKQSTFYDSMEEAATEFSAILTDEASLFYDVTFEYEPSYFEDNFSLSASVSLEDLIRQSEVQDIPSGEVEDLAESANGTYILTIELPGEVVETNADEQDGQSCSWRLGYGEVTQIELKTTNVFDANVDYFETLTATQQHDRRLFLICAIAGGALLLAVIVVLIVRRAKKKSNRYSQGNTPDISKIDMEGF